MKILVIGSGGREHTLCWKISQSPMVEKIYCAPGNGGTAGIGENLNIQVDDIDELLRFALDYKIDLTIVGPEAPLVMGIVDKFQGAGLKIFGPNEKCAQLEGSKEFSKKFMEKHGIPTAKYKSFTNYQDALKGIKDFSYPLVIKADGLCAGKGVIICQDKAEAENTLDEILNQNIFGSQGNKIVIEEFLDGIEASLLCFVTEGKIIPMESAKDYKQIFDGDLGPNTGGVGCYSPSPLFTPQLKNTIQDNILDKISLALKKDGLDFKGILFIGFMIVEGQPKVLEFNVRFGDPETQVLIPRLNTDLITLFLKTIDGTLNNSDLKWSNEFCITTILTSKGYPGDFIKGYQINGIDKLDNNIILFHNGTIYRNEKLLTNGGRVLSVTSLGETLEEARDNIYGNIDRISFEGMCYREDIGR